MKAMCRWSLVVTLLLAFGCAPITRAQKEVGPPSVKKAQVDTRYDFGGFQQPGNWYRGNLHLHSTISDGKLDPLPTVEVYRKMGYDFTALTDHLSGFLKKQKPLVYPLDQLNKPGFLVIPGIEYDTVRNGETIHYVVVGPGYDQRLGEGENLSDALRKWWDKGAFCFLAHPHWSLDSTAVVEDMTTLRALEVFNYAIFFDEGIRGNSELHWDRLLRQSRPILGVAVDDCHRPWDHAGGGWVMVKAKALTADAIVQSLRNGHFYASSGPKIENVFADTEGNLHVQCSPVEVIKAISVVGRVEQVKADKGKTIRSAVIKWDWKRSGMTFVRVACIDKQGRAAWSQAVFPVQVPRTKAKTSKR